MYVPIVPFYYTADYLPPFDQTPLHLIYNIIISCGKSKNPTCSVGETVVTGLAKDLFNEWRTMYVGNRYSSVDLAGSLLKKRII